MAQLTQHGDQLLAELSASYVFTGGAQRPPVNEYDGWQVPAGRSVIAEVYPRLWSRSFAKESRTTDQHDAYTVAAWLQQTDRAGQLVRFFEPALTPTARTVAQVEGWILGVV